MLHLLLILLVFIDEVELDFTAFLLFSTFGKDTCVNLDLIFLEQEFELSVPFFVSQGQDRVHGVNHGHF